MKEPIIVAQYKCNLCGDKGKVYRAYLEPYCGLKEGKQLIWCPKCVDPKIKQHYKIT